MRTTINLDDDVMPLVRNYADGRSMGLGKAVSELVRKGLNASASTRMVNGVVVFDLPPGSPRVSNKWVNKMDCNL